MVDREGIGSLGHLLGGTEDWFLFFRHFLVWGTPFLFTFRLDGLKPERFWGRPIRSAKELLPGTREGTGRAWDCKIPVNCQGFDEEVKNFSTVVDVLDTA